MLQGFTGRHPFPRLHFQQFAQEVNRLFISLQVPLLQSLTPADLRELEPEEPGVLLENLLLGKCERAQNFLNQVKLVNLTFPREQRLAVNHLSHDAANGPHIDRLAVVKSPQQQLWGPVPPCGDVVSQVAVGRYCPCEAEITQLQIV